MGETRNIQDRFRAWENDLIRQDLNSKALPYAVCMENWHYDNNLGVLIRPANAFGCGEVFYLQSKRHFDKRSAVGTYKYIDIQALKTFDQLRALKNFYSTFIGVENNIKYKTLNLNQIKIWPKDSLIIFGEEGCGLSENVLKLCDVLVEIPIYGSVRSLNCGTASGIVLNKISDYWTTHFSKLSRSF